jgi:GntP family gluconate:H+ symporter
MVTQDRTFRLRRSLRLSGAWAPPWHLLWLPAPLTMIVCALALNWAVGAESAQLPVRFGETFGRAAGGFSLIIIPSFVLAACLGAASSLAPVERAAALLSPVCAAGMVCPDTAYTAISGVSGNRRLEAAFGTYAGFKLLAPAGPLIIGTGLGVGDSLQLMVSAAVVAVPVLIVGWLWSRRFQGTHTGVEQGPGDPRALMRFIAPFLVLAAALGLGATLGKDFSLLAKPEGGLMAAAALAWMLAPASQRRACLESAIRRSAALLLLIGAAAALGAELVALFGPMLSVGRLPSGCMAILAIFVLTACIKTLQGSSMVTFAVITPVIGPLLGPTGLSYSAAALAVCVGSFALLLPNDSFYWLVRTDALRERSASGALAILASGSALQAVTGLGAILLAVYVGWL